MESVGGLVEGLGVGSMIEGLVVESVVEGLVVESVGGMMAAGRLQFCPCRFLAHTSTLKFELLMPSNWYLSSLGLELEQKSNGIIFPSPPTSVMLP